MTEDDGPASGWTALFKRHPIIVSTLLVCTLSGAIAGYALLTDDWSPARRMFAGALSGAGVGLLLTATKMFD